MDITTKDGITLRGIPDGTSDEAIKARIEQIRGGAAKPAAAAPKDEYVTPFPKSPFGVANRAAEGISRMLLPRQGEGPFDLMDKGANYVGGLVTDATGSPMAGTVANTALQAGPMLMGGEVAKLGSPALRGMAERLMQSAIKPSGKDLLAGKADRAAATMLDEGGGIVPGASVSRGGSEKLRGMGNKLNQEAGAEIAGSNAQINKGDVAHRLRDTESRFQAQVNPQGDLNAIENAETAFLIHPDLAGYASMPVQLAQRLKQGTYRQLKDKYGQLGTADTEAQKALARGLKEEIEKAVPGVVKPNAKAAEIFNALNVMERRALQAGNNNIGGLVPLASNPVAGAAFAIDRSSHAKSLAARLLNASKGRPLVNAARLGTGMATVNEE